jgi:hypothetical protein
VQAVPGGVGANGAGSAASLRHAAAGLGSVPPAGAQRSVQRRAAPFTPAGHTVTVSDVRLCNRLSLAFAATAPPLAASVAARSSTRVPVQITPIECLVWP